MVMAYGIFAEGINLAFQILAFKIFKNQTLTNNKIIAITSMIYPQFTKEQQFSVPSVANSTSAK